MAQKSRKSTKNKRGTPATAGKAPTSKRGNPRPVSPAVTVRKAGPADWIEGARLRTLPLAVSPILLGTGAAVVAGSWDLTLAILSLMVALSLQIGVNFANDYSDGVRGTDRHRVGPARLTGSGAAKPRQVLVVALSFFGVAALTGLAIVIISGYYWLLVVGAAAIVAAWFYTGGKRPYGYLALGEVFVFVFFGLVATAGTTYVQAGMVNLESWLGGVATGLVACAVLMVNNIRDRDPDLAAGKKTLAVLLGDRGSRIAYCILVLAPFLITGFFMLFYGAAWLSLAALLLVLPACLITLTAKTAQELVLALKLTGIGGLVYAAGLAAAFAF